MVFYINKLTINNLTWFAQVRRQKKNQVEVYFINK